MHLFISTFNRSNHPTTMSSFPSSSILFFTFFLFSIVANATVPPNSTFTIINDGYFGEYETENGASYRLLFDFQSNGFALCFYNTTPNAYTFGLRMGQRPEDSTSNIMRWVWDANRGNPVRDNATLTFGTNGNLVLADVDRRVVWQTGTANKGVVGINLLPNGNLVLVNSRGGYVWQSFDYPTDTLLVGQNLRMGGTDRLISRVSSVDGSKGAYSLVLERKRLALYVTSKNSPNSLLYYSPENFEDFGVENPINRLVFNSAVQDAEASTYGLYYDYYINGFYSDNATAPVNRIIVRLYYDSVLSFLRLESDGNIRIYTYNDKVIYNSWDVTFTLFDRVGRRTVPECGLPAKCGSLGVCSNNQCVGCPTPRGLSSWTESCAPPKLPSCKKGVPQNVSYYKVVGVEHFTNAYTQGEGPLKVSECRAKCNKDCGCLGFFYKEESSRCLLAPVLGTMTRVSNQTHVAYIKVAK